MWRTKIGKDWDAGQTGYDVVPQVGSWVKPDGWDYGAHTIDCEWDGHSLGFLETTATTPWMWK